MKTPAGREGVVNLVVNGFDFNIYGTKMRRAKCALVIRLVSIHMVSLLKM